MTSCSRRVFPEKVIAVVTAETSKLQGNEPVPKSMNLSPSMKQARLKDATVSLHLFNRYI
jgi:hypothetical protein